ncbi:MAG: glycosyl hydrolase family 18 protein [Defluviitaleaceae bacterium]|nr:glycosyl hydrolase family 18 protein [Defluviitaleaceae bacterium]
MIVSAYIAGIGHATGGFRGLRPGDKERLTHVNFAFAQVVDGKASVASWFRNGPDGDKYVRELMKDKGNLVTLLSIGGWGAGGFSPACMTEEGRELLAQSYIDIINDYGFDGADLDWEFPGMGGSGIEADPADVHNYTLWVQKLREKLGPDRPLTMACGGHVKCVEMLEIDKLVPIMDMFNMMTYDLCRFNRATHHTALYKSEICDTNYGDNAVQLYLAAGVPREKMTMGAAFYARTYKDVDGFNQPAGPENGPHPGWSGGWKHTSEFVEKSTTGLVYDEKAEAPYAFNARTRELYTFDNERSLKAKAAYCKENNLAGVMFWEYNCDDEDSTLLKCLVEDL